MPTHKDFPKSYFDDPDDWRRRQEPSRSQSRRSSTLLPFLVVLLLAIVVGLIVHKKLAQPGTSAPTYSAPLVPAAAAPVAPAGTVTQPAVTRPAATSRSSEGKSRILAIGQPLSAAGTPPNLVARDTGGAAVAVTSASPAPINIYVNSAYGAPLRYWTTLQPGGLVSQDVVTGHRYGYCFTQAATGQFAATRGCGSQVTHSTLNGARLPDGGTVVTTFTFEQ